MEGVPGNGMMVEWVVRMPCIRTLGFDPKLDPKIEPWSSISKRLATLPFFSVISG